MSQESPRKPRVPGRVGSHAQSASGAAAGKGRSKSPATAKGAGSNPVLKWAIRGVVGAVLIVLLVLAALDFMKKQQSTGTNNAWVKAHDESIATGEPLKLSKLESLIQGSPTRTDRPVPAGANVEASKVYTYTWSGTFRKYAVELYVDEASGTGTTVSKIAVGGQ